MTKITGIGNALTEILVHIPDETLLQTLHLSKGGMYHIDEAQMRQIHEAIVPFAPQRATGGSAANTIHALAALGDNVGFVGSVADDETGHFFAERQRKRGIDSRLNICQGGVSGIATTLITPDGERTFATHLGASTEIRIEDLRCQRSKVEGQMSNVEGQMSNVECRRSNVEGRRSKVEGRRSKGEENSHLLHVEGYLVQNHDLVEQVMSEAKTAGMTVSYDLASWNIVQNDLAFVRHLVKDYVDIAFANEEEAAAFSQQQDAEVALHQLAEMTQIAVVKVGKRGAYAQAGAEVAFVPGLTRKVVDTTAAGDFFAAGFLHGLIQGASLDRCLHYGNHLAGEVIQVMGTQLSDEQIRAAVNAI